jgi:hypothetical protein
MSFKAQLNSKVRRFLSTSASQTNTGYRTSFLETDLGADLSKLSDELLMKVCPTAVGYAATIVRQAAKEDVKNGGGQNTIGMSRKTKTRGVLQGGRMVSVAGGRNNKGTGAWSNAVLAKRGKNNKSLADTGGIVKKRFSRKQGGIVSTQIVGPRYETGPKGKNFAHTHEPKKGASSGAPNHKWWPRRRLNLSSFLKSMQNGGRSTLRKGRPLQARPWLIPAAKRTLVEQQSALKKALMRWDIDPSEVTR